MTPVDLDGEFRPAAELVRAAVSDAALIARVVGGVVTGCGGLLDTVPAELSGSDGFRRAGKAAGQVEVRRAVGRERPHRTGVAGRVSVDGHLRFRPWPEVLHAGVGGADPDADLRGAAEHVRHLD